ncbi:tetratricopeptide repeat protein [Nesterenkonia flava]|uniref:Tetratricopeptide repeat protein n=1 Tax=Nesterenkonia flava TaxID=469799 RepID=A0ABU1FQ60_9MICC|nr:tetratricopeptide repeat protein [Nesterenkonia flava]MDR5710775.1 tetratricopeptide repeat protein [Nesterenkonia flava]
MAAGLPSTVKKAVRGAEKSAVAAGVKVLGKVPSAGSFPGGEILLAREAVNRNKGFVPRARALMEGKSRRQGSSLPLLILSNLPHTEVELADVADREGFATPDFLDRVAARAAGEGDLAAAVRLRRRAVELDPETAHRHLALAQTLSEEPQEGVVHDWILGLAKGKVPAHSAEALQHFQRAYDLAPENPYVMHEYGAALVASGNVAEALPLMEMAVLKRPQQNWFLELAELYRRPDVAKFEKAMTYYERVFERDPKNMKALSGIINAGTRGPMDWARIWRSVRTLETRKKKSPSPYHDPDLRDQLDQLFWRDGNPEPDQVETLVAGLQTQANIDSRLHPTALGVVIARLQFARFFAAGFALRAQIAEQRTGELRKRPVDSPTKLRQLMKAHTYLDDAETAAGLADARFWGSEDPFEALQIQKMHADAVLMTGDAEPYIKYSRKARKRMPLTADDTMSKLIKGKRVALVGPAETGDRLGEVIDGFDVIVRPRYQPEFIAENREAQGSRTDITYYSGQDLTSLFESITDAAEAGEVKVVNARPFSHAAHAHRNLPWLRFYRQDFSLCFHGGSLGIQRMAYDLLQFEPAEICVFNSDLYTGNSMFTTGWRQGDTFAPYSHINDIVISHDVKWEFKFMKALMSTGIVTAQGRAAEVLAQTPDEYVRAVEEAGVLR